MPPTKLTETEIAQALQAVPAWARSGSQIERTFVFKDFLGSMAFVNRIAQYAEKVQHHPDILVRWNKVTLSVSTHDCGGISIKDFDLAKAADAMSVG